MRPLPLLAAAAAALSLSACQTISGLDAGSSFGCKALPGVSCQSISGTYANAVAGSLPAQRSGRPPQAETTFGTGVPGTDVEPSPGLPAPTAVRPRSASVDAPPMGAVRPAGLPVASPGAMNALSSGMPIRSPERVVRIWVAPFVDTSGDLHDQKYLYTTITNGRWLIEANQTQIRTRFQQVRPLTPPQAEQPSQVTPAAAAAAVVQQNAASPAAQ